MCFACRIKKATNTHSACVVVIVFPLQQWLHERASILRYTYIAVCLMVTRTRLNITLCVHCSLSDGYTNAPQRYVIRTLQAVLFTCTTAILHCKLKIIFFTSSKKVVLLLQSCVLQSPQQGSEYDVKIWN